MQGNNSFLENIDISVETMIERIIEGTFHDDLQFFDGRYDAVVVGYLNVIVARRENNVDEAVFGEEAEFLVGSQGGLDVAFFDGFDGVSHRSEDAPGH